MARFDPGTGVGHRPVGCEKCRRWVGPEVATTAVNSNPILRIEFIKAVNGKPASDMLALPKEHQMLPRWQMASESLLTEVDVREFSRQVELALLLDGQLDVAAVGSR
jgi:hypothetical protein